MFYDDYQRNSCFLSRFQVYFTCVLTGCTSAGESLDHARWIKSKGIKKKNPRRNLPEMEYSVISLLVYC